MLELFNMIVESFIDSATDIAELVTDSTMDSQAVQKKKGWIKVVAYIMAILIGIIAGIWVLDLMFMAVLWGIGKSPTTLQWVAFGITTPLLIAAIVWIIRCRRKARAMKKR